MSRQDIIYLTLGLGLLATGCASTEVSKCSNTTVQHAPAEPKFVHAVFFTMKPDTSESAIDSLVDDAYTMLAKIPAVRKIESGRRDERMMRDVNDKDFTVGLMVYFDDKAGHDAYSDHPLHTEYVAKNKEHWANVRVYDF